MPEQPNSLAKLREPLYSYAMQKLSRRSFLKNSGALVMAAGFIPLSIAPAAADETATNEVAVADQERDSRRAKLSGDIGRLLDQARNLTPAERIAWHRANRGAFFFSPEDIAARRDEIVRLMPERKAEIIQTADRLRQHKFDILGSGLTPLGPEIDWQRDFKSGRRWTNKMMFPPASWHKPPPPPDAPVYCGPFYSVDGPADLKVPWDLSNMMHFLPLAEAFLLTGHYEYANEIFNELRDWNAQNPCYYGVNWSNPMAAALRLANVLYTFRLLEDFPQLPAYDGEIGVVSLLEHVEFILDGLEIAHDGGRNNHYLSDLLGLAFGAVEFAGHPAGQSILDFVHDEFAEDLTVQFLADGSVFEGSVPYTRYSAEGAVLTHILLERNNRPLSAASRQQLERALHCIDLYTKPNGLAPQIGDNDNGRVLVLHNYGHQEYRDHRHILAVGAAWLGMEPLLTDVSGQAPDTLWLLGKNPPDSSPPGTSAKASLYRDGGFAFAKTANSSLAVRAGLIHPLCGGGHNHCDQLSFEFQDRGEDLIIDPGSMVYGASGALRNQFRSTASHNTLQLDDLEQQEFNPRVLFSMHEQAHTVVDFWKVRGSVVRFHGHHSAYATAGWEVAREILCHLEQGRCDIHDIVKPLAPKTQGSQFCGRLHLATGVQVTQTAPHTFQLQTAKQQWQAQFSDNLQMTAREGQVSPSYGVMFNAPVIEYRFAAVPGQTAKVSVQRVTS